MMLVVPLVIVVIVVLLIVSLARVGVDEPRTCTFECRVPRHAGAWMRGTLVVEGASS